MHGGIFKILEEECGKDVWDTLFSLERAELVGQLQRRLQRPSTKVKAHFDDVKAS